MIEYKYQHKKYFTKKSISLTRDAFFLLKIFLFYKALNSPETLNSTSSLTGIGPAAPTP
jgi:hypothetical protein